MKRRWMLLLAFWGVLGACTSSPSDAPVRPPMMGWSSWNAYMTDINDSIICHNASLLLAKGLKDAGYRFVDIDDGYFGGRDAEGRLVAHPAKFPRGLRPVVEYIHGLGLLAGTYSDAGARTCGSIYNNDAWGLGVGLWEHEADDADRLFNEWGFDFIKIDFCGGRTLGQDEEQRYRAIRAAMDSVATHEVRMNACRWDFPGTWVREVADSWRISPDIRPRWSTIRMIVEHNLYLSAYATGGRYNDMDMLAVGYNGPVSSPFVVFDDDLGLTDQEEAAHFGLWCIMASPLLLGCDLAAMPGQTLRLVTNPELIALNQDPLGQQARVVQPCGEGYVLAKDLEQRRGTTRAVALYNPSEQPVPFSVPAAVLELSGPLGVRDLMLRADLPGGDMLQMEVPPHAARFLRVTGAKRLEPSVYEAEWGYCPAFSAISDAGPKYRPLPGEGAVVTGLGGPDRNELEWSDVWSDRGGRYVLSLAFCGETPDAVGLYVNDRAVEVPSSGAVQVRLRKGWNRVVVGRTSTPLPPLDGMWLRPVR